MRKHTADSFWLLVERRKPDECWPWLGYALPSGYGRIRFEGWYRSAHAVAWALANRESVPSGRGSPVCHTCDNPPCCNPAHLFRGTPKTNTADMMRKGRNRAPVGERCGTSKVTWPLAREIRARYATEYISISELARQYGFALATLAALVRGDSWKEPGMVVTPARNVVRGEHAGRSRLKDADIVAIRRAYRQGESQRKIAARYGVSQCAIRGVVTGKTWRHIPDTEPASA